jgi:MoCo/4Fe-4S cofactor protein with predicted Tat translocation signal
MNPSPADRSTAPTGPRYWRSLDELAETPAFRDWLYREFPQGASEWQDPVSRRHFMKIMSASFLLAGFGFTGCRRPEEIIHPFSKMPEHYTHGVAQYYATSMPRRFGAQPLLVKSMDGRPLKVEGNPGHPLGLRGTDRLAQASILDLYDPDRATRFLQGGNNRIREAAVDYLAALAGQVAASSGDGVCFLLEPSSSPSRARLQKLLAARLPKARWFTHEGADGSAERRAAAQGHGLSSEGQVSACAPFYRLDRAKVIVSLDSDFLGCEADTARYIRDFAVGRRLAKAEDEPSRLYVLESLLSITGANADHRHRLAPSGLVYAAAQLAAKILAQAAPEESGALSEVARSASPPAEAKPGWLEECAKDLLAHRGRSVVLAGHRQPLAVHLLAAAINRALGNVGATVDYLPGSEPVQAGLESLAASLNRGEVKTLIICGGNPAYTAPADLAWAATQRKAASVVRLGYYEDETTPQCDWHLPAAHYLESWGDARTSDGTVVSVQPLIAPLFGGMTEIELLARLAGLEKPTPYDIVRETFSELNGGSFSEESWKRFVHDGFLEGSANQPLKMTLDWANVASAVRDHLAQTTAEPKPAKDSIELVFHRDYRVDDGTHNNNGWLQELPDPITKVTWENVVTVSVRTAKDLGIAPQVAQKGEFHLPVVKVELEGRKVEGPVWVQPGQADYTLGLALGYGREKTGRVGAGAGFNAFRVRSTKHTHLGRGARVTVTGRLHKIATTQDHWAMEGRPIVREANLNQYRKDPAFAQSMDLDAREPKVGDLYSHPHEARPSMKGTHQWGMTVDLQACVGCSTCVIACQSENNIPIVGKDQVARGREMHWIRLDRYFSVGPDDQELGDPQVLNQPMLCQHCENAPCENVCPVNATVHDEEGLNVMAYNRCVGTRYCSNNCPFKVRRFNFFDYNQRPLDKLYLGPLAPKGMPDLVQMAKNPEVTVRMRGVMEKCTFCIQRIEAAKIEQKIKAGASGDVRVPDGKIVPACAQACPAEAIVFGDVSDPNSQVSRMKREQRNYSVLGFLNVRPRTTYLARIRNPNANMPDYHQQPLSLDEQARKQGTAHGEQHTGEASAKEPAGKGDH